MPKDHWWFKFEYLKWITDEQLGKCSLETQGFWIRCICMMRKSDSAKLTGTIEQLCRLLSVLPDEFLRCFSELSLTKTAGVTQTAKNFTLMSRKFQKELKLREQNRLRKRRERCHANVTDVSRDRVRSKSKNKNKEIDKSSIEDSSIKRLIADAIGANSEKNPLLVEVSVIQTLINRNGSKEKINSIKYFDPEIARMAGTSDQALESIIEKRRKQLKAWQINQDAKAF